MKRILLVMLFLATIISLSYATIVTSPDQMSSSLGRSMLSERASTDQVSLVEPQYAISTIEDDLILADNLGTTSLTTQDQSFYDLYVEKNSKSTSLFYVINSPPTSDLVYSFDYSSQVFADYAWINYTRERSVEYQTVGQPNMTENGWYVLSDHLMKNQTTNTNIMFSDGNAFDYGDIFNSESTYLKEIDLYPDKITLTFGFKPRFVYPYVADPTFGSGTIQDCFTNGYSYCNVTTGSTISATDFVLTNKGTLIKSGVTITMDHARALINSSEYFTLESGATFNGNGLGNNGGTGGSVAVADGSGGTLQDAANGATNGANGNSRGGPAAGLGSGVTPFEFASGGAGSGSYDADAVTTSGTGGGFYATGGAGVITTFGCGSGNNQARSGGSGHAIKIISSNIQIFGSLSSKGGSASFSFCGPAVASAGGSGAGELLLYGAFINVTSDIDASGGGGAGQSYSGGAGGQFKSCYSVAYSNNGTVNLAAGTGGGSAGTSTLVNATSCFPTQQIVNMYTVNNTVFSSGSQNAQVNIGTFQNSTSCNYTLNGVDHVLGAFNVAPVATVNIPLTFANHTNVMNVTCSNASAGITPLSSENLVFNVTSLAPTISLNFPQNNAFLNSSINFNWTCTGDQANYLANVTIDTILNASNVSSQNATATNFTVSSFSEGQHNWFVTCFNSTSADSALNNFTFDSVAPVVNSSFPANAALFNVSTVNFNFTSVDNISSTMNCSLYIDNSFSMGNASTQNNTITNMTVGSIPDGIHSWQVRCTDDAGNLGSGATRNFTVDTAPPLVALNFPQDNYIENDTTPTMIIDFNITATDNLSSTTSCNLFVDSVLVNSSSGVANASAQILGFEVTPATHIWNVSCSDLAGNIGYSSTRTFLTVNLNAFQGGGGGPPLVTTPPEQPQQNQTVITTPPADNETAILPDIAQDIQQVQNQINIITEPSGDEKTPSDIYIAPEIEKVTIGILTAPTDKSNFIKRGDVLSATLAELDGISNMLVFGKFPLAFVIIGVFMYYVIQISRGQKLGTLSVAFSASLLPITFISVYSILSGIAIYFGLRALGLQPESFGIKTPGGLI